MNPRYLTPGGKRNLIRALGAAVLLALAPEAAAQEWQWAASAGSADNEYMKAVAVDADGNTFIAGQFFSEPITFGDTTLVGAGVWDMFLAKYSPSGEALWARRAGGTGIDMAKGAAADAAGNVIVAGHFSGTADFGPTTLTSVGGEDVFVAKYAPDGELVWLRRAGGPSGESPEYVAVDAAGNAYVVGTFNGTATFGGFMLTSAGSGDVFVVKYDADGQVDWATRVGGPGQEFGDALAVEPSGAVLVAGEFSGTATFGATTLTSAGNFDAFVARLSPAGEVLWARRAGGSGEDVAFGVDVNAAGEAYVAGYFRGTATFAPGTTLTSAGNADVYLAKYDAEGTLLWVQRAGGALGDFGEDVAVDDAGNAYVSGYFFGSPSFGAHTLASAGDGDVFVAGYAPDGRVRWAMRMGGPLVDWLTSVALHGSDVLRVGATFRGTVPFGQTILSSAGASDLFLVSLDVSGTVGVEGADGHAEPFGLRPPRPNPAGAAASVGFTLPASGAARLSLHDVLGRELAVLADGAHSAGEHTLPLDASALPPGVYLLRLHTPHGVSTRRLTVAR